MIKFLIGFLMSLIAFLPVHAFAATQQVSSVLLPGGNRSNSLPAFNIPVGDFAKIVALISNGSLSTGNYYAFQKTTSAASNAIYQVPAGKTFICMGYYAETQTANSRFQFGYGTATFTNGTGSTPTGAVDYNNTTSPGDSMMYADGTSQPVVWYPFPISFPANSFPYLRVGANGTMGVLLVGTEL